MRFHPIMLALLGGVLIVAGCDSRDDQDRPSIPVHDVLVDGQTYDVELRRWCNPGSACELLPSQDVHWEIQPDGRVAVMHVDQELRFERGAFFPRAWSSDPHYEIDEQELSWHTQCPQWIPSEDGDYLLAMTGAMRALIIHYPLN